MKEYPLYYCWEGGQIEFVASSYFTIESYEKRRIDLEFIASFGDLND